MSKNMAEGARMIVDDLKVSGSKGQILGCTWEREPSEAFRRLVEDPKKPAAMWKVVDGDWYRADC